MNEPAHPQKIIVLANSKPWSSAIEHSFPKTQLVWALSLADVSNEIAKGVFCAAILEIPGKLDANWLTSVSNLSNNAFGVLLFGIGDEHVLAWQNVLNFTGFAGRTWSLLQLPSLIARITKHQQNSAKKAGPLEASIEANLPWANASNRNLA